MDEYRSNYKGKVFGVKRIQNFFAVEEANVFGDLTKYDFLLKDSCIYSYNGNHTYQAVIMAEACKEPIFNGWRIENLVFPGNWYGNWLLIISLIEMERNMLPSNLASSNGTTNNQK